MPRLSQADQAAKVSANEARRRKECALAELRELEVAERAGRLIPVERVAEAWAKILAEVRNGVMRIPDNCASAVAAARDDRKARNILSAECELILRNLSNDVRKLAEDGY